MYKGFPFVIQTFNEYQIFCPIHEEYRGVCLNVNLTEIQKSSVTFSEDNAAIFQSGSMHGAVLIIPDCDLY